MFVYTSCNTFQQLHIHHVGNFLELSGGHDVLRPRVGYTGVAWQHRSYNRSSQPIKSSTALHLHAKTMVEGGTSDTRHPDPSVVVDVADRATDAEDCRPGGGGWGARHTLAVLGCLGIAALYAVRVSLSIAIVAMVWEEEKEEEAIVNTNLTSVCPLPDHYRSNHRDVSVNQNGEFDWDEKAQGLVLGSFFWGYTASNFIGGRAAEHYGGRIVFGLGVLCSSLLTLVGPVCARSSLILFITSRVLAGLMQGVTLPAVSTLLATWVPPAEKSMMTTIVFTGYELGTIIAMASSGWLCSSRFLGGWPSVFYIFGGSGVVFGAAWFLLVHDRPEKHPRISPAELRYIQAQRQAVKSSEFVAIPWKALLTSLPFWAVVVASLGDDLGFDGLLTEMPNYLKNLQHFDLNSNGLLSALPYMVTGVVAILWAMLMDHLTVTHTLTITSVRKISEAVAMYGPAVCMVGMCFVGCNWVMSVVVLCLLVGLNGVITSGHHCSNQDLAPNLAGTMLGITNTSASFMGVLAPTLTAFIIQGNQTLEAWRTVFIFMAVVYFITATFFITFITAEVQPWNAMGDGTGESDPMTEDHEGG
ncbi:sialin-like isoform X2 [Panulirus ornatus]|uniref:sialin-like isoform X2 n=1 Tax=Panulirus ornatus TaxID=150431 RepID=UPI003A84D365